MFKIKDEAERATVYIYGVIGDSWDEDESNRAKEFSQTLDELSPKPIDIRIDSPGGDVFEGYAIASAVQRYDGDTHAYIDGVAASAASYIALMADKVTMNDYSAFMIHNAWGIVIGNRHDMRAMADQIEGIDDSIARIISGRTGMELDAVKDAMDAETWYFGNDALENGFCDEVIETEQRIAARIDGKVAERFKNIPDGIEICSGESDAEARETVTADDNAVEPPPEDHENGASHALPTISDNEVKDAAGAILLGNRVYRKEQ